MIYFQPVEFFLKGSSSWEGARYLKKLLDDQTRSCPRFSGYIRSKTAITARGHEMSTRLCLFIVLADAPYGCALGCMEVAHPSCPPPLGTCTRPLLTPGTVGAPGSSVMYPHPTCNHPRARALNLAPRVAQVQR